MQVFFRSFSFYTRDGDDPKEARVSLQIQGWGDLSFEAPMPEELHQQLREFALREANSRLMDARTTNPNVIEFINHRKQ